MDKTKNLIFGFVKARALRRRREGERREEEKKKKEEGRRKKRREGKPRYGTLEGTLYGNCMESTDVWIMYGLLV